MDALHVEDVPVGVRGRVPDGVEGVGELGVRGFAFVDAARVDEQGEPSEGVHGPAAVPVCDGGRGPDRVLEEACPVLDELGAGLLPVTLVLPAGPPRLAATVVVQFAVVPAGEGGLVAAGGDAGRCGGASHAPSYWSG